MKLIKLSLRGVFRRRMIVQERQVMFRRKRLLTPEEVQKRIKIRRIIFHILYPIAIALISFLILMALKV